MWISKDFSHAVLTLRQNESERDGKIANDVATFSEGRRENLIMMPIRAFRYAPCKNRNYVWQKLLLALSGSRKSQIENVP
jgi:hypothetical protein